MNIVDAPMDARCESGFDILSESISIDPFPFYEHMRRSSPVGVIDPGGMVAIFRFSDVQYVLRQHDIFSSTGFLDQIYQPKWMRKDCWRQLPVLTDDPPVHTVRRRLINKAFVTGIVQKFIPLMYSAAHELVGELKRRGKVEFIGDFAYPYIGRIIGKITGLSDRQNIGETRAWLELMEVIGPNAPDSPKTVAAIEHSILAQYAHFADIIRDRTESPKPDLISELVSAEIDGERLTPDVLQNLMELLLGAGLQTTVHLLGNCIIQLSRNSEIFLLLRSSPNLIPAFIEEQLRFDPPTHRIMRLAREDVTISGVEIKKGSIVMAVLASANRDADTFAEPNSFQLQRKNIREHVAFGYGIHACVGAALARAETRIALEVLLSSIAKIECPPSSSMSWIRSMTTHGVQALPSMFR
jgi:cytochrome P450